MHRPSHLCLANHLLTLTLTLTLTLGWIPAPQLIEDLLSSEVSVLAAEASAYARWLSDGATLTRTRT